MLDVDKLKEDVALFAEMKKSHKEQFGQLRILNDTMLNLTKYINEGIQSLSYNMPLTRGQNYQLPPPLVLAVLAIHQLINQIIITYSEYVNPLAMQRQSNTYNFYTYS